MNFDSKQGIILSQESLSTCGTNNSAFFRVDIEPNEMKYSMSDISVSGLVNSLTRSRSYEEITGEARNELETAIVPAPPNSIVPPPPNSIVPVNESNDMRRSLASTRSNSQLKFALPFQKANPPIDDDPFHATPYNAGTIFRNQTGPAQQNGRMTENIINPANPVHGSSSDGASQQLEIKSVSNSKTMEMTGGRSLHSSGDTDLDDDEREQSELMTDDQSEKGHIETSIRDEEVDITPTSLELQFAKENQQGNTPSFQSARTHTSSTKRSDSTQTSCLTSETVIFEEDQSHITTKDDSVFAKLRSHSFRFIEKCSMVPSSIAFFCSRQMNSIVTACRVCNDSTFHNTSRVQKTAENSCIDEERIAVEQWAKQMNLKVSELHDFIKLGSIAALNSAQTCGAIEMDYSSNTKTKPHVDSLSLLDENSLIETNGMIEKQLQMMDEGHHVGEISSGSTNFSTSTSTSEENMASNTLSKERAENRNGIAPAIVSIEVGATEQFIEEVDEYAAKLGIGRAEFLSKIAFMIKEHNEEQHTANLFKNTFQDILELLTTSCNPSNLSTNDNSFKQHVMNASLSKFEEGEDDITQTHDDEILEGFGLVSELEDPPTTHSHIEANSMQEKSSRDGDKLESKADDDHCIEIHDRSGQEVHAVIIGEDDKGNGCTKDSQLREEFPIESSNTSKEDEDSSTTKASESTRTSSVQSQVVKRRRVGLGKQANKMGKKQANRFIKKGRFRLIK